jgi:hypothetical protein
MQRLEKALKAFDKSKYADETNQRNLVNVSEGKRCRDLVHADVEWIKYKSGNQQ